jgi:hypothetical protein
MYSWLTNRPQYLGLQRSHYEKGGKGIYIKITSVGDFNIA